MPQIVGKPVSSPKSNKASNSDMPIWKLGLIVAGVLSLLVVAAFVGKKAMSGDVAEAPTHVAPLPGFGDSFPFNTKEWQDKYKKGQVGLPSGVPGLPKGLPPPVDGAPPAGGK